MTISLAIAAIIAIPSVANAQEVKTKNKAEATQCCTQDKKECNKECKCDKDRKCKKGGKSDFKSHGKKGKLDKRKAGKIDRGQRQNLLFKGITLSEQQQQQLNALCEKQCSERKAEMTQMKKEKSEQKALKAQQYKLKSEAYDKEVEKILTPDQMKQYQANEESMKVNKVSMDKNRKERRK